MKAMSRAQFTSRAGEVFLVGDMLHPLDDLAVECLLDRDVGHPRSGRRPMPVPAIRRTPDHIARANLEDRPTLALRPSTAGGDDERLAERMAVPRRACAWLKGDAGARDPGRLRRAVQRINPHGSGEVFCGSLLGRL